MIIELNQEQIEYLFTMIDDQIEWLEGEGYQMQDREIQIAKALQKIFLPLRFNTS